MHQNEIRADMLVEEVVSQFPATVPVFMDHGLPCIVCGEPVWGTIEENARRYDIDLETLVKALQEAVSK
ncbi:MAG TPA: DUF1858 domain-containing protein [Thermoanaerobaculia bacterium]|nr:DUF1858 domain-containing protein [Thermoanaerobaculia bacterium]HUM28507.1 DUF1858 domain-containing protein [Thermoanaerobaculia bacterium]HXK66885.1 DUF1858 domain-containing protein [Thermoanaerobaculia bacterium]